VLAALDQRIGVRYAMAPMTPGETSELEHPEFGGDSILPRCSCLGGPLSSTVPPPGGTTV